MKCAEHTMLYSDGIHLSFVATKTMWPSSVVFSTTCDLFMAHIHLSRLSSFTGKR